jgi:uncharacterized damage-inducible protein DinB
MSDAAPTGSRRRPTYLKGERELLDGWLEFHRATLLAKCEGLSPEQLRAQPVTPSPLSLHGLVRHMAETERNWFGRILPGNLSLAPIWESRIVEDNGMVPPDDARWNDDLTAWLAECEASRKAAAERDLQESGSWRGKDVTLRSIYQHMIQEYARHNGHADLIRESLDGSTGL